jgi:hypothetical protein
LASDTSCLDYLIDAQGSVTRRDDRGLYYLLIKEVKVRLDCGLTTHVRAFAERHDDQNLGHSASPAQLFPQKHITRFVRQTMPHYHIVARLVFAGDAPKSIERTTAR